MTGAATILLVLALAGCAGTGRSSAVPSSAPQAPPSEAPAAPVGSIHPDTPTACMGLEAVSCAEARALAATALEAGDPAAIYVQVGPFGCAAVERCPATLAARPEGDVTIEWRGAVGITVHLVIGQDGSFEATRGEPMGVPVEPSSVPGIVAGPVAFTLGHCGVLSGIDHGGSWWDPVGPVDVDAGESINATAGILTVTDPDHATFTTPNGSSLALQRRIGPKLLPLCM